MSFICCFIQVRLIVIDSVTFHFRQGFEDMALRTRLLSSLSLKLMALVQKHDLAVSNYSTCLRLLSVPRFMSIEGAWWIWYF